MAGQLPNGNYGEGLIVEVDGKHYLNLIDEDGEMLAGTKPLPPGTYRFLFTTKAATEEDARKVVRELPVGARYENYSGDYPVWYHTEKESLSSLLRSKGLDQNKNYALIENCSNDQENNPK